MSDLEKNLGLVPEADVAQFRKVKITTLRNERAMGKGPPYQRIGNKVFYPIDALRKHLALSETRPSKPRTLVDGGPRRAKSRA